MGNIDVKFIQDKLCKRFENHKYHLLNSYIFDWEADYFSISASGYSYEIEIKLSKSDFIADFKKKKHYLFKEVKENRSKARKLPHKFFYACPTELIKKEDIPIYAGLIYISDYKLEIIKEAPFLHKREYNLEKILLNKFYWKTIKLTEENIDLKNSNNQLEFLLKNKKP